MAQLIKSAISTKVIETILRACEANGQEYFDFALVVNDEAKKFGQNVSFFVQKDKDAKRWYFGNGRTVWSNKNEFIPEKPEREEPQQKKNDDLPF
jgi:hypothetical protein